jgi:hypothetical protein
VSETVIIRKQKFRIKTNSEDLALQLRHELNDHLQVGLLAVYEEVFASIPGLKDDTIYIDKLQLDLGRCSATEFATQLPQLLKQAMLKKLDPRQSTDEAVIYADKVANERRSANSPGSTDEVTTLFHFFEKGYFPWWVTSAAKKKPEEMIASLSRQATENLLVKIISAARHAGEEKANRVRQRFLQHLSVNDQEKIVEALIALQSDQQLRTNIQMLAADATMEYCCSFIEITTTVYRAELILLLLQSTLPQEKEIFQSFIRRLMNRKKASDSKMREFKKETKQGEESVSPVHTAINTVIDEITGKKKDDEQITKGKVKNEDNNIDSNKNTGNKETDSQSSPSSKQRQPAKKKQTVNAAGELPEEGVYVDNGGLVILHPFFQPLFTELELLSTDGKFVAEEAKARAAVILQYLFTGDTAYAEYDMVLNKLFCGIAVEEVLPEDIVLTEKETSECDGLLDTVIQYWDALKGASKEAVRQTFFQRKAKIRFKDDHWLFQVERSAMDILLDRLPWGIGIIRLPWLQHLIHVEW